MIHGTSQLAELQKSKVAVGATVGNVVAVGVIEGINEVRLGAIVAVAVGSELTCPQPVNRVITTTKVQVVNKRHLIEFIVMSMPSLLCSVEIQSGNLPQ